MAQANQSGRIITLCTVVNGLLKIANAGDFSWSGTTLNAGVPNPPFITSGVVRSAALGMKMWFADGSNWRYYDPATNTVYAWTALFGTLPSVIGSAHTPRHICAWRGRICLAGLEDDPRNWFFSAVNNPQNWDFAPGTASVPTQAVAGTSAPQGLLGDIITSFMPYTDDLLFIGGQNSIYRFSGDPMAGGQIDLVSSSIGVSWGQQTCMDAKGILYFMSNRGAVYSMVPGNPPERISQQITRRLENINMGTTLCRLVYDDRRQGLWLFVTPTTDGPQTTHYFWDARANAWWPQQFGDTDYNPLATCLMDGETPGDRVILTGSWDGYVRQLDINASTDDGTAINSFVIFPPILTTTQDEMMLRELQAIMDDDSGTVTFAVSVGRTAKEALAADPTFSGTFLAARNYTEYVRRSGHTIFVKISSSNEWAMEQIRAVIEGQGGIRRRGRM